MGEMKDLVDLVGKLVESVQDRDSVGELRQVQSMLSGSLSEHAELHESRIVLMTENDELKKEIPALNVRIAQLQDVNLKLLDPPPTEPLSEEDIKLLCEMKHRYLHVPANGLCDKLGMSLPILDHKADLVCAGGYLIVHRSGYAPSKEYSLSKKGRKRLYEKNLLG
jgi:hypothetical protein